MNGFALTPPFPRLLSKSLCGTVAGVFLYTSILSTHAQMPAQGGSTGAPSGSLGPTPGQGQSDPLRAPPPQLGAPAPKSALRCERYFVYKGQLMECDSPLQNDGENLRPILSEVPQALEQLELYQAGRQRVEPLAYVGTAGLALALIAIVWSNSRNSPAEGTVKLARNLSAGLGLGLAAGSLTYGITSLHFNERHLERAIELYNQARPETPLQLQFTTEIDF